MFDPLSALSCIGFAIGAVGFLATGISQIDERVDRVKECRDLLLHFNIQLKDAQLQLKAWRSIWISEPHREDEIYIYLWGQDGFDEVQTRWRSLLDLSTRMKTLLRRPIASDNRDGLSSREMREWHHLLKDIDLETNLRADFGSQELNLLRRIGFSLFRNTALQEKIGRFKSQVQGLDDYSMRTFRLLRNSDPNSKVSPEEVRDLIALKQFIDRASMFGASAFGNNRPADETDVALELSPPEEDQTLDMWKELDDLHLCLFIRSTAASTRRAARFRLTYELEAQNPPDESLELIEKARLHVSNGVEIDANPAKRVLLAELERPIGWSRPLRKMLRDTVFTREGGKSFDLERANLIYGLAHWFIHFWNTPWAVDLCSCSIRQVRLPGSRTRHSLTAGSFNFGNHSTCRPVEMANHKLTLLGKALAEAALGVSISLDLEGSELRFVINGGQKTRGGLIADLSYRYGRTTITRAIRYCFDPAHADHERFLPEDMEPFCQNVLKPSVFPILRYCYHMLNLHRLARFHAIMEEHCGSKYGAITRKQEVVSRFYGEHQTLVL